MKSPQVDPTLIQLTYHQAQQAVIIGVQRHLYNLYKGERVEGWTPQHGAGILNDWQYQIEGAMGEYAVALYLGVFYDGAVGNYKARDVAGYQVRTSPHPYLCLHPNNSQAAIYITAYGVNGRYRIAGWMYGSEGMQEKYWGDKFKKNRPAFWVPVEDLRAIEALPLIVEDAA